MKKMLKMGITLVMAVSFLTGCGSGTQTADGSETVKETIADTKKQKQRQTQKRQETQKKLQTQKKRIQIPHRQGIRLPERKKLRGKAETKISN